MDEESSSTPKPRRGFSKIVSRVRDKIREKRQSISGPSTEAPADDSEPVAAVEPAAAAPTATEEDKPAVEEDEVAKPESKEKQENPHARAAYERTKTLLARHGLDISTLNYPITPIGERVEKPIRQRIVRTCHRCETKFGGEKICSNCNHTRCKKCPRYPAADRKKTGKTAVREPGPVAAPGYESRRFEPKVPLTRPARVELQDRVRRAPKMRVTRTCHVCFVDFLPKHRECAECGHPRCTLCERVPPKHGKFPDGYPGDVPPEKDAHKRVKFTCHSCQTDFAFAKRECTSCGHTLCRECKREPPLKADLASKPEKTVGAVERGLESVKISA